MLFPIFKFFYFGVKKMNKFRGVVLQEYLERSGDTEKSSLINGRFDYQDQTLDGLQVSGTLAEIRRFTYPFTIAVFYMVHGRWWLFCLKKVSIL